MATPPLCLGGILSLRATFSLNWLSLLWVHTLHTLFSLGILCIGKPFNSSPRCHTTRQVIIVSQTNEVSCDYVPALPASPSAPPLCLNTKILVVVVVLGGCAATLVLHTLYSGTPTLCHPREGGGGDTQ